MNEVNNTIPNIERSKKTIHKSKSDDIRGKKGFKMSSEYIEMLRLMYSDIKGNASSIDPICEEVIPHELLYQSLLLPAAVFTLILAFAEKRVHHFLQCLSGRPGVVFPMDIMGTSNRFSYAAAFGATASLCGSVLFEQKYAITLQGPAYVTAFSSLLSMLIYGLDYLPLFIALTANTLLGYGISTLYAWTLTAITFLRNFWCNFTDDSDTSKKHLLKLSHLEKNHSDHQKQFIKEFSSACWIYLLNTYLYNLTEILIIIARNLPELLCHVYLSVSCPVRLVQSLWRKKKYKLAIDVDNIHDVFDEILNSYQGLHVRKLFKPPSEIRRESGGIKEKLVSFLCNLYHKVVYHRLADFRYSSRMVSVSVISFILIYEFFVEAVVSMVGLYHFLLNLIDLISAGIDDQSITSITIHVVYAVYVSVITSLTFAFIIGCIMILHTLASYRNILLRLYNGDSGHLIPKSKQSNTTLLVTLLIDLAGVIGCTFVFFMTMASFESRIGVKKIHYIHSIPLHSGLDNKYININSKEVGSMHYAGYQVAYVAFGYFAQSLVLFLVSSVLSTIIILIIYDVYGFLLIQLNNIWPVLLTSLVVNILQNLMARFAFLQNKGKILALNNRRVFLVVVYFMFFCNIFLGLVSCLLRVVKAIVLGTLLLPRLDHSILPREFQWLDPGFGAFCAFMYIENAHTHPVVLTFISLLEAEIQQKKQSDNKSMKATMTKTERHTTTVARSKWKLAYTLIKNPQLLIQRKSSNLQRFIQIDFHVKESSFSTDL